MKKALLFGFVFLFCCTISFAQNGQNDDLPKRFANWRDRSMMKGCDTTYIQLPEHAWTIKLNENQAFLRRQRHRHHLQSHHHHQPGINRCGLRLQFGLLPFATAVSPFSHADDALHNQRKNWRTTHNYRKQQQFQKPVNSNHNFPCSSLLHLPRPANYRPEWRLQPDALKFRQWYQHRIKRLDYPMLHRLEIFIKTN